MSFLPPDLCSTLSTEGARVIIGIASLILLWLALTRDVSPIAVGAACVAAAVAFVAQRWLFPRTHSVTTRLLSHPGRLLTFLATLALRFVQSTLYTCRLILLGGEEGRIVALPSGLRDPLAQFMLSIAITLTPSTISLLIEDDLHYIHWLGAKRRNGDWRKIKDPLERRVARLVERRPDALR
jgi:multisubunit Na+/H+ antiporter MnhE subunit